MEFRMKGGVLCLAQKQEVTFRCVDGAAYHVNLRRSRAESHGPLRPDPADRQSRSVVRPCLALARQTSEQKRRYYTVAKQELQLRIWRPAPAGLHSVCYPRERDGLSDAALTSVAWQAAPPTLGGRDAQQQMRVSSSREADHQWQ